MDKLMVLDGDFEAELCAHLKTKGKCDEDFAIKALQSERLAVYQTHLAYLRAGAQVIRTNTYRVTFISLQKHLHLPLIECLPIMTRAVRLAQQAVCKYYEEMGGDSTNVEEYHKQRPLVAGSCGSYNVSVFENISSVSRNIKYLIPECLKLVHKSRAKILLEAGVDLLAFESIPSWKEMDAIIETLKEFPFARAWITFSCSQDARLFDGSKFANAAILCYDSRPDQIVAIGAEGILPETMTLVMRSINDRRKSKIPFVLCTGKYHLPTISDTGASMQQHGFVEKWFNEGIRYFGGGVNTVADNIKEIRKQVDDYRGTIDNFTSLNSFTSNKIRTIK